MQPKITITVEDDTKLVEGTSVVASLDDELEDGDLEERAKWTTKYINDLPDSAFAYIETGGKKDSEGKTIPRDLRHFPYKDASGKLDYDHIKNALGRIPQSSVSAEAKASALKVIQAAAKKVGIDVKSDSNKRGETSLTSDGEDVIVNSEMEAEDKERAKSQGKFSLIDQHNELSKAVEGQMGYSFWMMDAYADHVVVVNMNEGKLYAVPYTRAADGTIQFDVKKQSEVQKEYTPVSSKRNLALRREADGTVRWLSISSNTFKDSYKTNFSRQALNDAVEYMRSVKNYGELRVEHHPKSHVGLCDSSIVLGNFLLETGTFDDTTRAQKAIETLEKDSENQFRVSLGFIVPKKALVDGEFKYGARIRERSITASPSNKLTAISPIQLGGMMTQDMQERLAAIVGDEEAKTILDSGDEDLRSLLEGLGMRKEEAHNLIIGFRSNQKAEADKIAVDVNSDVSVTDDKRSVATSASVANLESSSDVPAASSTVVPDKIQIVMPDGKIVDAVRDETLDKLVDKGSESASTQVNLIEAIRQEFIAAIKPLEERLVSLESSRTVEAPVDKRSENPDEWPRAVLYRVTQNGPDLAHLQATDEEQRDFDKELSEPSKFWDGMVGGKT